MIWGEKWGLYDLASMLDYTINANVPRTKTTAKTTKRENRVLWTVVEALSEQKQEKEYIFPIIVNSVVWRRTTGVITGHKWGSVFPYASGYHIETESKGSPGPCKSNMGYLWRCLCCNAWSGQAGIWVRDSRSPPFPLIGAKLGYELFPNFIKLEGYLFLAAPGCRGNAHRYI